MKSVNNNNSDVSNYRNMTVNADFSGVRSADAIYQALRELENYGVRVQYSVFECDLDNDRYQEMYQKLIRLMNDIKEGSIRFYEVCSECRKKTHIIGIEKAIGKYNRDEVIVL